MRWVYQQYATTCHLKAYEGVERTLTDPLTPGNESKHLRSFGDVIDLDSDFDLYCYQEIFMISQERKPIFFDVIN